MDMHLLGKGFHKGFTAEFLGKQIGVMDFQSRRGFPGVPESALKKMAELKGSEELHLGETSGCKCDGHLALKLMLAMEPQLSMAEARTTLLTRNLEEDDLDASGYIDDVEDEYCNDVVLLGDQKSSKGVLKAMRDAKERRAQVKISTQRLVTTCFEAKATAKKKPKAARGQKGGCPAEAGERPALCGLERGCPFGSDRSVAGPGIGSNRPLEWAVDLPIPQYEEQVCLLDPKGGDGGSRAGASDRLGMAPECDRRRMAKLLGRRRRRQPSANELGLARQFRRNRRNST